jgi:hypothetical protein
MTVILLHSFLDIYFMLAKIFFLGGLVPSSKAVESLARTPFVGPQKVI